MRSSVTICFSLTILLAMVCCVSGREQEADNPSAEKSNADKSGAVKSGSTQSTRPAEKSTRGKGKKLPGFTGEREAAAMTFVRTNHPELAELLDQLKISDHGQYQRAIRDLFKSSERLAQIEERNPQRYPLELSLWKVNSRIQVLVAKMTMSPEPATEVLLRQALAEHIQLRKQLLSGEQQRLEQKLAELKAELDDLQQHQPQRIDERMAKLLGEASRTRPLVSRRGTNKNASGEQKSARDKNTNPKSQSPD